MNNSDSVVSEKIIDKANEGLAHLERNLKQAEETLKSVSNTANQVAEDLGVELKEKASGSVSAAENYIRQKPLQAAGLAFGAGIIATMILRQKK